MELILHYYLNFDVFYRTVCDACGTILQLFNNI